MTPRKVPATLRIRPRARVLATRTWFAPASVLARSGVRHECCGLRPGLWQPLVVSLGSAGGAAGRCRCPAADEGVVAGQSDSGQLRQAARGSGRRCGQGVVAAPPMMFLREDVSPHRTVRRGGAVEAGGPGPGGRRSDGVVTCPASRVSRRGRRRDVVRARPAMPSCQTPTRTCGTGIRPGRRLPKPPVTVSTGAGCRLRRLPVVGRPSTAR